MRDKHTSFIKTPKQLVIVVVLAFLIPIALVVLVSQLITDVRPPGRQEAQTGVLNRIKPVGEVTLVEASAPQACMTGEKVYQDVCKVCHEAGLVGAPKWATRRHGRHASSEELTRSMRTRSRGTDKMPPRRQSRSTPTSTSARCLHGQPSARAWGPPAPRRLTAAQRCAPRSLPRPPRSRQPRQRLWPVLRGSPAPARSQAEALMQNQLRGMSRHR